MTDRLDASEFDFSDVIPASVPPRRISWTPDVLARLDREWHRLQRNFAYHPVVRVIPLEGEPPSKYQIEYNIRSLGYNDAGELDHVENCSVTLELPNAFPDAGPIVRPTRPLFHPNISVEAEQVAIIPDWSVGATLEDVVSRVGVLLAFQAYDPNVVWNPVAMQWVTENASYLPTDPSADLSPDADGQPAVRIRQHGPATLKQLRGQVREICLSMLNVEDPPTASDVREFAQRTRMAVSLFLAPDMPAELTAPATEVQAWMAELPAAVPVFEALRTLKAHTLSALTAENDLLAAEKLLSAQLAALGKMVAAAPATDPYAIMRQLPARDDLKTALEVLRGLFGKAERPLAQVKQWAPSLTEPQRSRTFAPMLQDCIDAEAARLTMMVQEAKARLGASIQRVTPIIDHTRHEIAALEQLLLWKEFSELTENGHSVVMRSEGWGAAAMQAYFVAMSDQEYGPFEFEQQVDLGVASFAIRNPAGRTMELVDLKSGRKVAASDTGEIHFDIPGETKDESYPVRFHMTARCDELWMQLDRVLRHTQSLLTRATVKPVETPSWCGKYTAAIASKAHALAGEYRTAVNHWTALSADLKALGAFKARLATYHLVKRIAEQVPVYMKQLAAATVVDNRSAARISEILSRSTKEPVSGQMIIPARFHKEYNEQVNQREEAEKTTERVTRFLQSAAAQIRARRGSKALYGSEHVPDLHVLSPLSDNVTQLADELTDGRLGEVIEELAGAMRMDLAGAETAKPPAAPAAARPPSAPPPPPPPASAPPPPPPATQLTGLRRPASPPRPPTARTQTVAPPPVTPKPLRPPPPPPPATQPALPVEQSPPVAPAYAPAPVAADSEEPPESGEPITPQSEFSAEPEAVTEAVTEDAAEAESGQWAFVDDTPAHDDEHDLSPGADDLFSEWPTQEHPHNPQHGS